MQQAASAQPTWVADSVLRPQAVLLVRPQRVHLGVALEQSLSVRRREVRSGLVWVQRLLEGARHSESEALLCVCGAIVQARVFAGLDLITGPALQVNALLTESCTL